MHQPVLSFYISLAAEIRLDLKLGLCFFLVGHYNNVHLNGLQRRFGSLYLKMGYLIMSFRL
jgi:hypothetical protein